MRELKHFRFLEHYLETVGGNVGCSEADILEIEAKFGVQLPEAYKEYLLLFGVKAGYLMDAYLMTIDQLDRNRKGVEFMFANVVAQNPIEIQPTYFVFGQWQGSYFLINCDGKTDDPAVGFLEHPDILTWYKDSFTKFVLEEGLIPLINNLS